MIYKRKEHNIPGIKTSHEEKEEGEATKNKTKRKNALRGQKKTMIRVTVETEGKGKVIIDKNGNE